MRIDDYDAVVYDLDGTLVRLAVDWDAVAREVGDLLRSRDVTPPDDLWTMLDRADETGHRAAVEATIAEHETTGARNSERLAHADGVPVGLPVGVCSLNCEAACHVALETHDLSEAVHAVVGRDSVATKKPDPEPLLAVVRELDVAPGRALFVGDSERDEVTASRAGTDFRYV
jgi:phosphoglycolate phosphatase